MPGAPKRRSNKRTERVLLNVKAAKQRDLDKKLKKEGKKTTKETFLEAWEKALLGDTDAGFEIKRLWATKPPSFYVNPSQIPDRLLILAAYRCHGVISAIARFFGVERQEIAYIIEHNKIVAEAVVQARESVVDLAETRFFESIGDGAPWAVERMLDTYGKKRGYGKEGKWGNSSGEEDTKPQVFVVAGQTINF